MPVSKTTKSSSRKVVRKTTPKKLSPKRQTNKKLLAVILLVLGILMTITPLLFYANQTIQLAFFTPKPEQVVQKSTHSISHISIPSAAIDLPTTETAITNGAWEIAKDKVSYLKTSAKPGENGTIIMYSHNTAALFKNLPHVKTGDTIIVTTSDAKLHVYKVQQTLEVFPNQMEVFYHADETLVIYTCSGFADLQRFIVIAKPSS